MLSDEWNLILGKSGENELIAMVANGEYGRVMSKYPQFYSTEPFEPFESGESLDLLAVGVAGLNSFCQLGWTGPKPDVDLVNLVDLATRPWIDELTQDGEAAYRMTPGPRLLLCAKRVFAASECKSAKWWLLRACFLHQRLLENPSASLYADMLNLMDEIVLPTSDAHPQLVQELQVRLNVEKGLILSFHHQDKDGALLFKQAAEQSGLQWQFSGALGKRTRFQQNSIAQLVVEAKSATPASETKGQPERLDVKHGDDLLFEAIKFDDESNKTNLKPLDQTILLALCMHVKKTSPVDGLTTEEMASFVNRVLENPNNWMIHTQALLLRSRFESVKARTVERSALQLQALVDQFNLTESTVQERMLYFYSLMLPAKWEMEVCTQLASSSSITLAIECPFQSASRPKERFAPFRDLPRDAAAKAKRWHHSTSQTCLVQPNPCDVSKLHHNPRKLSLTLDKKELGERYISIGVVATALEIFTSLEMWEEAIECLKSMDKRARAEKLVRERLEQEPTNPSLWCLLGDLLQDPAAYERAWQVSHHRHARAMRSLASYFFKRNQDKECIECYRKALAINPLFENSWFVMGCAAARCQEFEVAAEAFTRCVALDDDNSEAWNNLASIYIRQQKKTEAFNALQQALKHSYDNWKMWQNYMFTATDLHDFTEAIKAMERVVELRATKDGVASVDFDVLRILVDAVRNGTTTFDGRKATFLTDRMQSVLDMIVSKISTSPDLWRVVGEFAAHTNNHRKALDAYQRAYRCVSSSNEANHSEEAFVKLADVTVALVDAYTTYGPMLVDGEPVSQDWQHQAKIVLRSITGRTKPSWEDHDRWTKMRDKLDSFLTV